MVHAVQVGRGGYVNALPDTAEVEWRKWWVGKSGVTGHETCYEPPEGLEFTMDAHCEAKYFPDDLGGFEPPEDHYRHGDCVWTDMDCDVCTGFGGKETFAVWRDPAGVPAPPHWRVIEGDHAVTVEWDNRSEVYVDQHLANDTNVRFIGYNVYRLDDWRGRRSDIPTPFHFQQIASFGRDKPSSGKTAIAEQVGEAVANLCKEKGVSEVVFDRNGYLYHGRVKALADGARKGGLNF